MAVVGALNQLVAGLHSGLDAGFKYGEKGRAAYSQRKMGQAEAELEKYMSYDPTTAEGAIDADGNPTMKQPNVTDLMALRREYNAAARLSGDPDAIDRADERWATQLKTGANSYIDMAIRGLADGDHATVKRALEHAYGFVPNGLYAEVQVNDEGQVVVKGYNELNGEPVDEKVITAKELQAYKAYGLDPKTSLEWARQNTTDATELRQKTAEAQRQANLDVYDIAETKSKIKKNLSAADLDDRTDPNITGRGGDAMTQRIRVQTAMQTITKEAIEKAMMHQNPHVKNVAVRNGKEIHEVAVKLALANPDKPFHTAASQAIDMVSELMLARTNGVESARREFLESYISGGDTKTSGIPVE